MLLSPLLLLSVPSQRNCILQASPLDKLKIQFRIVWCKHSNTASPTTRWATSLTQDLKGPCCSSPAKLTHKLISEDQVFSSVALRYLLPSHCASLNPTYERNHSILTISFLFLSHTQLRFGITFDLYSGSWKTICNARDQTWEIHMQGKCPTIIAHSSLYYYLPFWLISLNLVVSSPLHDFPQCFKTYIFLKK